MDFYLQDLILIYVQVSSLSSSSQDERLLVVQIPRRHVELSANQHRHLSQCQRSTDRDVRSIVLHCPAGRWCSEFRGHVQLLQERLVPYLLQSTYPTETRHVRGPTVLLDNLRWDEELRDRSGTPAQIKDDSVILHGILVIWWLVIKLIRTLGQEKTTRHDPIGGRMISNLLSSLCPPGKVKVVIRS